MTGKQEIKGKIGRINQTRGQEAVYKMSNYIGQLNGGETIEEEDAILNELNHYQELENKLNHWKKLLQVDGANTKHQVLVDIERELVKFQELQNN